MASWPLLRMVTLVSVQAQCMAQWPPTLVNHHSNWLVPPLECVLKLDSGRERPHHVNVRNTLRPITTATMVDS